MRLLISGMTPRQPLAVAALLVVATLVATLVGCRQVERGTTADGDALPARTVGPTPGGPLQRPLDIDQNDNLRTDNSGVLPVNGGVVPAADGREVIVDPMPPAGRRPVRRVNPGDAPSPLTPDTRLDGDRPLVVPGGARVPDLDADVAEAGDGGQGRRLPVDAGQAMPVGAVLARVNGEPVYTDAVLEGVRPVLRAKARTLPRDRYRQAAVEEINGQLRQVISDRLALAAAKRGLSDRDRRIAGLQTVQWREEQIIKAGGSVARADARARELGYESFDEMTRRKGEELLVSVYYQRQIQPRVRVSADEMRDRYARDKATVFSDEETATFRLIEIRDTDSGGRQAAEQRARSLKAQLAGADVGRFAEVAAEANDDPGLAGRGGKLMNETMGRGTYRDRPVEDAAFEAEVGTVAGPVRVDRIPGTTPPSGGYYLVFVEDRTGGEARSFGDPDVQRELRDTIRQEKFSRFIAEDDARRRAEAVISEVPGSTDTAIDIALHDYDVWTAGQ